MAEELRSAVRLALDPSTQEPLRSQARVYCEQLRASEDGWQLCLSLFLEADPKSSPMEVRFYALSVIEEALRLRSQALESSGALLNLRSSLWVWIQTRLSDSEPVYLRNKLATLVSLIFQQSYLGSWHGFFEDLLALGYSHQGKPDEHPLYIDFFLRVSGIIDEEIVAGSGARESAIQTRIKDAMRVSATKKLTESWLSILITFHESRPDLASMVFRLFGLYVSWIDVQLVLNDRFLALLFSSLNNSEALRIPATECLTEIVAKGMKPSEKLALIQGLNVHSLLERLCSVSASEPDDVLDTATARLVNLTGSEICSSLETSQFSPDLRHIAFDLLDRIFPSLLSVLSKTDIEIISIPFSFLSSFLSCLKKLKKLAKDDVPLMPGLKEKLASLLRILVLKMRYDLDSTFTLSLESNEDDQFLTFRREIKNHFDCIFALEPEMYTAYILSAVCSTFDSFSQNKANVPWVDAELAIYLLFIYHEVLRAPCVFVVPGSQPPIKNPMSEMMSKLVMSNISVYPHLSISLAYFETITRYAAFFDDFPDHIPLALASFVDERGLHHPHLGIKSRVSYLFLRFVKILRDKIRPFVGQILHGISDRLAVSLPTSAESAERLDSESPVLGTTEPRHSPFESQLFLFEAVGKLISIEAVPEKQAEYLSAVVGPLMSQMQETYNMAVYQASRENIMRLNRLIVSVGSIGKGFPDFDGSSSTSIPPWSPVFSQAFQVMVKILEQFNSEDVIREAVRFSLQRLVGCMGSDIMSGILPVLKSGLICSHSSKELVEFLNFAGMLTFKFKSTFAPILHDMIAPLRERTEVFLSKETTGTDDVVEVMDVKRAYMSFFASIFNADQEGVLTSEVNLPILPAILQVVLSSMKDFNDVQGQKIASAVLVKMVIAWAQDPETAIPLLPEDVKPSKKSSTVQKLEAKKSKPPLKGFDQFVFESLVPVLFEIPYKNNFNLSDGQTVLFLTEIGSLHKVIYSAQGTKYLTYLANIAFPSLHISPDASQKFLTALSTFDVKVFKTFLQDFVVSTRR